MRTMNKWEERYATTLVLLCVHEYYFEIRNNIFFYKCGRGRIIEKGAPSLWMYIIYDITTPIPNIALKHSGGQLNILEVTKISHVIKITN